MSQIIKRHMLGALLFLGGIVLIGCGTPNSESIFNPDTQKHQAGWLPAGHMTAARTDITVCNECHGQNLDGGISNVSCTTCHMGGATSIHLADWAGTAIRTQHGPYVLANGYDSCRNQYCHGNDLLGVTNSGPSCKTCH